jgi:rod shape-determining protein MreD
MSRGLFLPIFLTAVIGFLLMLAPLPGWASAIRPGFLVLVVIYWSTMAPYSGGITLAFLSGIALDAAQGGLIGQHAFALSLIAFLAIRFHLLMRAKPLFEQSFIVLATVFVYELCLAAIDGWTDHGTFGAARWIYPATSALIWPIIVGFMGRLHVPH